MSVKEFAVLGAGVMGAGIAGQAALAGINTRLYDLSLEALNRGLVRIDQHLDRQLQRGKIVPEQHQVARASLKAQLDQQGFDKLELLVEAVVESESVKRSVLTQAESRLPLTAILATNTSTISIDQLAESLQRPQNFCGLHFFNPVAQMQLVEVVRGSRTRPEVVDACVDFAQDLGKQPVVVKDCPGFLVNRILFPYFHGFDLLLKQGVSFARIDQVMQAFGWPMGPAYLADVIGMDVMVGADRVLERGYPERMSYASDSVFSELQSRGLLGQKQGAGFYLYRQSQSGERIREINHEIAALYPETTELADSEIIDRMMLPMVTESLRCLDEGVVATAAELSLAATLGLGYPAANGGLAGYIGQMGVESLSAKLERYAQLGGLYQYTGAAWV